MGGSEQCTAVAFRALKLESPWPGMQLDDGLISVSTAVRTGIV